MAHESHHQKNNRTDKKNNKRRSISALAGLLIATFVGIFLFWQSYHLQDSNLNRDTLSPFQNPSAGIRFSIPQLMKLVDESEELKNSLEGEIDFITKLDELGVDDIDIFLFPNEEYGAVPVMALRGVGEDGWQHLLQDDKQMAAYVKKTTEGQYRFNDEGFPENFWGDFPAGLYRISLSSDACIIAPEQLLASVPAGYDLIDGAPVAQFGETVRPENGVVLVAFRFPLEFIDIWQEKMNNDKRLETMPILGIMADLVMTGFRQLTEPFEQLRYLAFGFAVESDKRVLHYAQQFQEGIDSFEAYEKLQSHTMETEPGLLGSITAMLDDRHLTTSFSHEKGRLEGRIEWQKKDDQPVVELLAQATIGALFETAMFGGEPTEGEITPSYTSAPQLRRQVDPAEFEENLRRQVGKNLFPGHYWSQGEKPSMRMELDPVDIPNRQLATLEYEVVKVITPDGRNIYRPEEKTFPSTIDLESSAMPSITLDIQPGTPAQNLHTAVLRFDVSVPNDLKIFEFTKDSRDNTKKENDIHVIVERIEKDIAEIRYQGGNGVWLFAYDKTGRAISAKEMVSSSSSIFNRFDGEIERLQVVVAGEVIRESFLVETDLNQGEELTLQNIPQVVAKPRFDYSDERNYVALSREDLDELEVEWYENEEEMWAMPGPRVWLPQGPCHGKALWQPHFFGAGQELKISGWGIYGHDFISYNMDSEQLDNIYALFGKVHLRLAGKIERHPFIFKENMVAVEQPLESGGSVELAFNQNQISYRVNGAEVVEVKAFDAEERRLRQDSYYRKQNATSYLYFWGKPVRAEVVMASDFHERTIDFDLQLKPLNAGAYKAFKESVVEQP